MLGVIRLLADRANNTLYEVKKKRYEMMDKYQTVKKLIFISVGAVLFLSGCAGLEFADRNAQREFTFDYVIENKSKSELWRNARDYFAESYGDSRAVFRIMDEKDGTIIGRGTASWSLVGSRCCTDYHVRFAAKDNKARLQFEIIEGVPSYSSCKGWPWPSRSGYQQIVSSFYSTRDALRNALEGKGSDSKLKDF